MERVSPVYLSSSAWTLQRVYYGLLVAWTSACRRFSPRDETTRSHYRVVNFVLCAHRQAKSSTYVVLKGTFGEDG